MRISSDSRGTTGARSSDSATRILLSGSFGQSFFLQASGAGIAYVLQIAMAASLGPAAYGAVITVMATANVAGLLASLGTGSAGLRRLPGEIASAGTDIARRYSAFAYSSTAVCSVIVGSAAFLLLPGHDVTLVEYPLFILLVMTTALVWVGSDLGRAIGRFTSTYSAALIAEPLCAIVILLSLRALGAPSSVVVGTVALGTGYTIGFALQFISIATRVGMPSPRGAALDWPRWLKGSPPYLAATVAVLLLTQVDLLVCSHILTPRTFGYYAAAAKVASAMAVASVAVSNVVAPTFARLAAQQDYAGLLSEANKATRWQLVLAGLVACCLLAGANLILALYGHGFAHGASALRVIVVGQLVGFTFGPGGSLLVYAGRPKVASLAYAALALVAGLSAGIGAANFGLTGAAVGSGLGYICAGWTMVALSDRLLGINCTAVSAFRSR